MRSCYDAFMRTTIDLSAEAYHIAKAVAHETGESLGATVSKFITQGGPAVRKPEQSGGLPIFRCVRRVTSADVRAVEEDE
jgi:hypothetical protein